MYLAYLECRPHSIDSLSHSQNSIEEEVQEERLGKRQQVGGKSKDRHSSEA